MDKPNITPIPSKQAGLLRFSDTYVINDLKDISAGVAMVLLYAALLRSGKSVKETDDIYSEVKNQLKTNTSLCPNEFTTERYRGRVDVLETGAAITLCCPKSKYALCQGAGLDLPASVTHDSTTNKLSFTINLE
jgi:hypothetical protein